MSLSPQLPSPGGTQGHFSKLLTLQNKQTEQPEPPQKNSTSHEIAASTSTAVRADIPSLLFFSCVTFLLPPESCVPSGQAIKLEDQQYMTKEWDQFAEKWLEVVYYIFYLFCWEITCHITKREIK